MTLRALALAALALLLTLAGPAPARAADLPPGFEERQVASLPAPTALAFLPDGAMLVATQRGQLRLVRDGALRDAPVLDLAGRACTNSERGLLGVAVDPDYARTGFVYLYFTRKGSRGCGFKRPGTPVNRVARFTIGAGEVAPLESERVLIDGIPSPNGNHNAGDVQVGKDGFLYVTTGDGGCDYAGGGCAGANDASRDPHVLLGKVLRVTRDGAPAPGNPWERTGDRCAQRGRTTAGRHCAETFARGLRNPFRMAFDPNAEGTRFFVNDVGQGAWEEVDEGRAGADYGWNRREGPCQRGRTTGCTPTPSGLTDPLFAYRHRDGCASITGGAFVPARAWPAPYSGAYLYSDYVCGTIFRLAPVAGGGFTSAPFVTGLGSSSAVHMAFGPDGALHYTTYRGGGEVRRIAYAGAGNRTPTARLSATPTAGSLPLDVAFDASGSSDPDAGDGLTYLWDFGDGTTRETGAAAASHRYATAGAYTATLRVRDGAGATSAPATVRIDAGNAPPVPVIEAPGEDARFGVGEEIVLRGRAQDPEDGVLPASRLSWTVLRRHDTHSHPFLGPETGAALRFAAPGPEDLAAAATSSLEVVLTATDARGASASVTRVLPPRTVELTFRTAPAGLELRLDDALTVTGPSTVTSWEGYRIAVDAPGQTDAAGRAWAFASWSDGGAAKHAMVTPARPATYEARFTPR